MYAPNDGSSRDELITRYSPLVKRIAYHLIARLPASVIVDDLIQAGLIGLLDAAQQYDDKQGASFETYATIRVRGAMLDELRRNDWAPKSVHRKARQMAEAIHRVEHALGRDATDQEVAAEMGVSLNDYHQICLETRSSRLAGFSELGLDEQALEESGAAADGAPLEQLEEERFRKALAEAIGSLPERERLILSLYYDEELNLREIGAVLSVSESRVSQLLSQTHQRLKARLRDWSR